MQIIKPGRLQKGWSKECTCTGAGNQGGGCGAVLLVEEADLFITQRHCRDESESFLTFECMACNVLTDLGKGVPPPRSVYEKAWAHKRSPKRDR